jgi:hypothetical protein
LYAPSDHVQRCVVETITEFRAEVVAKEAEITSQREAIKRLQVETVDIAARRERLETAMAKLAEQPLEDGQ